MAHGCNAERVDPGTIPHLDRVEGAGELDSFGDPADEGVVVRLDGVGREVALRVPGRVDPDVVAGNALVALHPDDRLGDFATCGRCYKTLGSGEG